MEIEAEHTKVKTDTNTLLNNINLVKRQVTEKAETVIDEAESGSGSAQHEKKVSKYIFFGNPKLNPPNEEEELIEDD